MPFLILFIALFPLLALRAWVIQMLMSWFLVPLGVPLLSIPEIMGVLVILVLLKSSSASEIETVEDAVDQILRSIVYCVLTLGMGWVVSLWL